MLPRFSIRKQQTANADTVLVSLTWGTLDLGFTVTKRPLTNDFEDELYPGRPGGAIAIGILLLAHFLILYFLLTSKVEPLKPQGAEQGHMVLLDLADRRVSPKPKPAKTQPEKKVARVAPRTAPPAPRAVESIPTDSPVAAPPVVEDTMSRLAARRAQRAAQEEQAVQENNQAQQASKGPSENDIAMARIKANIAAANYSRKGTNGIFQIQMPLGVQTGRFTFMGWTNDPHDAVRRTYEVDAGVGGDVQLAIVKRVIQLIREHYQGDFNWVSDRMGRTIVLSAREQDNAQLESFLMMEFFDHR